MKTPGPNKAIDKAAEDAASVERCRKAIAAALAREGCKLGAIFAGFEKGPGDWVRPMVKVRIEKV